MMERDHFDRTLSALRRQAPFQPFAVRFVSGESIQVDHLEALVVHGHQLRTAEVFDYEVRNSYHVRVRSTDAGGLFTDQVFTIAVTDVPEPRTFEIPAGRKRPADSNGSFDL